MGRVGGHRPSWGSETSAFQSVAPRPLGRPGSGGDGEGPATTRRPSADGCSATTEPHSSSSRSTSDGGSRFRSAAHLAFTIRVGKGLCTSGEGWLTAAAATELLMAQHVRCSMHPLKLGRQCASTAEPLQISVAIHVHGSCRLHPPRLAQLLICFVLTWFGLLCRRPPAARVGTNGGGRRRGVRGAAAGPRLRAEALRHGGVRGCTGGGGRGRRGRRARRRAVCTDRKASEVWVLPFKLLWNFSS